MCNIEYQLKVLKIFGDTRTRLAWHAFNRNDKALAKYFVNVKISGVAPWTFMFLSKEVNISWLHIPTEKIDTCNINVHQENIHPLEKDHGPLNYM